MLEHPSRPVERGCQNVRNVCVQPFRDYKALALRSATKNRHVMINNQESQRRKIEGCHMIFELRLPSDPHSTTSLSSVSSALVHSRASRTSISAFATCKMFRTAPRMAGYVSPCNPYNSSPAYSSECWWMGFRQSLPLDRWH